MSMTVFLSVLGAAVLHATWNALVKGSADKWTSMGAVVMGQALLAVLALGVAALPDMRALPYMAAALVLHAGYQISLLRSYEKGDLSQVYPIARGSAPLMVALFSVAVLGVHLHRAELAAVAIIGIGILSLALVRRADGLRNPHAARLALTTGVFIASYSLVDGMGARVAGTSLGFYAWVAVGNALLMALFLRISKPAVLGRITREGRVAFAVGGSASFVAYAIVTWAFTQAPIALVTALRETSIVFALLIGVFFFKERLDLAKVFATAATVTGVVLLRFARHF